MRHLLIEAVRNTFLTLTTLVLATVAATANFIHKSFGPVSLDQIATHLSFPGLLDFREPDIYRLIIKNALIVGAISAIALYLSIKKNYKILITIILALSTISFFQITNAIKPSATEMCELSIDNFYTEPSNTNIAPPDIKPHLIVIFVESLEKSYQSRDIFEKNLTPRLSTLEKTSSTYGNFYNVHGTEWTMGGIFGALCSMPLKSVGMLHYNKFRRGGSFYENGVCLPDILSDFGYKNSYFQGTSLRFAGMNKFLESHSFSDIRGIEELSGETEGNLYDKDLFDKLLPAIYDRISSNTPQFIGISTIDTHPPGTYDSRCDGQIEKITSEVAEYADLANAYQCLDINISEFIQKINQKSPNRPIHIYIMGDHLSMKNPATPLLEKYEKTRERHIYLSAINGNNTKMHRNFSHFDILPTILGDIGFRWNNESSKLGLGVNLNKPEPSLIERYGLEKTNSILKCESFVYNKLWLEARSQKIK